MLLSTLLPTYDFMYWFLGYWKIDSDFLIFWIEEANFDADPIIELNTRLDWKNWPEGSIPFDGGYYHPNIPLILSGGNSYWKNWLEMVKKAFQKNFNIEDIFLWELRPFPKPHDATISEYYWDNNIKTSSLYYNNGLYERRRQVLRDLIFNSAAKVIFFTWYEKELVSLLDIKPDPEMKGAMPFLRTKYLEVRPENEEENHDTDWYYVYEISQKKLITIPHLSRISPERLEEVISGIKAYIAVNPITP